jgi:DnaJ-class molecular chaperone
MTAPVRPAKEGSEVNPMGCDGRAGVCERCRGSGEVEVNRLSPRGEFREDVPMICGECGGTGREQE